MKIEKILFPTRFKELAFNCLKSLFVLKDAGLREVVLCHIIERDEVAFVPFGGYLKKEEERFREEVRIKFEDWRRALSENGIDSKIVIEVGDHAHKILSIAETERVDLVVVGRKKRTGIKDVFIGSRTLKILRRSLVPVLVSKYMVEFEWNGELVTRINDRIFDKPLLATDWSSAADRALELITSLQAVVKGVVVCHVMDVKVSTAADRTVQQHTEAECMANLRKTCEILEGAGIETEFHLVAGRKAEEILRISRDSCASMIVTGTTGKNRLHEIWSKSLSRRLAKISELPTLLVREGSYDPF